MQKSVQEMGILIPNPPNGNEILIPYSQIMWDPHILFSFPNYILPSKMSFILIP